ncbi:hypothetical protein CROQUDRAFT_668590 [Cronartium quercuum f. sp. fusiforme G11]|uniref:Uncharacterized protein n=1 Tax=Cronartium quercuum f. sp. fusiforme G11 TaxID=708437 RepID=A0A9P6TFK0_9BASI|nr:hypothetical protein CROQUDRAFT_668590 [Cronartium quercuum f. sp. fusiforme G11]
MAVNSNEKPPPCPRHPAPPLSISIQRSVAIRRAPTQQTRTQSISQGSSFSSGSQTIPGKRLSASAIGIQTITPKDGPAGFLQSQPRPRYSRRSIGVLPITRSYPSNSSGSWPKRDDLRIQSHSPSAQNHIFGDVGLLLRSPVALKHPKSSNETSSPQSVDLQDTNGFGIFPSALSELSKTQQSDTSEGMVLVIEDHTPPPSHFATHLSQTDLPASKQTENSDRSPKFYSLLTSGSRAKNSGHPSPRLKASFLSALNKSEPNLLSNYVSRATQLQGSADFFGNLASNSDTSTATKIPLSTQFPGSPGAKTGSPSLNTTDATRQTPSPNTQQQKMKAIIFNTSKRISIFTSRLHHTSAAHRSRSGNPSAAHKDGRGSRSPILISNTSATAGNGSPTFGSANSIDQSLLSAIPQMTAQSCMETSSISSSNNRIHSPGFYRSLKMRWKLDQSSRRDLPTSPSNTAPIQNQIQPQTFSSFEQLKRTQKQIASASEDLLSPQIAVPDRSSRISLADFLTSRGPRKKDNEDFVETMAAREPDSENVCYSESKKLIPRAAQTHPATRPRASSTSSTISNMVSGSLANFALDEPASTRRFSHLKLLQLQETVGQKDFSGSSRRDSKKVEETTKSKYLLHPEVDLAKSALSLSSSLDSILDHSPESLTRPSSVVQGHGKAHTEGKDAPNLKTFSITVEPAHFDKNVLNGPPARESAVSALQSAGQRKVSSDKYDDDLMTFLLPSPRLGSEESKDALELLPALDSLLQGVPSLIKPESSGDSGQKYPGARTSRRSGLVNGSNKDKSESKEHRDAKEAQGSITECSTSALADTLHHTKYLSSNSRRSSISSVLKRKDPLITSTPQLFQEIWEKELAENERKWKRLARISDSQVKAIDLTGEIVVKNLQPYPIATHLTGTEPRDSISNVLTEADQLTQNYQKNERLRPADPVLLSDSPDCLTKIWNSFKSEADISLSEVTCETSLNDDQLGNINYTGDNDYMDHHYKPEESEHLDFGQADEKRYMRSPLSDPYNSTSPSKPAVVGLGLIDTTSTSSRRFDVAKFKSSVAIHSAQEFMSTSSINSPKLKRLSLLCNKDLDMPSTGSKSLPRKPTSAKRSSEVREDNSSCRSSILDLSLLNSFPSPPKSQRSSLSSVSSHSNKSLISPRKNKARLSLLARCNQDTGPSHRLAFVDSPNSGLPASISKPDKSLHSNLAQSPPPNDNPHLTQYKVHQPISFSNRPRAQTGAPRSPAPPPLQIITSNSTQLSSGSSSKTRRKSLVVTSSTKSTSHSMRSPIYSKPALPPPLLPLPRDQDCPSLSMISGQEPRKTDHHRNAESPSSSSQLKLSPGGVSPNAHSPGGLLTKRPSLVIRPKLTSSRTGGIYPTSGVPWALPQGGSPSSPKTTLLSPSTVHQDTRASAYSPALTARSFITDLHNDLVEQTRDAAQSTSSHTTCSSLSSSVGNSSMSTVSTISSPCTPSSSRYHSNPHIPPVPLYKNVYSPSFANNRLGRVLLSPPELAPLALVESSQLLSTPRSVASKGDLPKASTPSTIRPTNRPYDLPPVSCSVVPHAQILPQNRRGTQISSTLCPSEINSNYSAPNGVDQGDWVSYGMAM